MKKLMMIKVTLEQSGIDLLVISFFSRFLACSSPGSTPSGTTRLQYTVPCSVGSARQDASQTSSWVPCTHSPDRPLPQPSATLSRLSPPPASDLHLRSNYSSLMKLLLMWSSVESPDKLSSSNETRLKLAVGILYIVIILSYFTSSYF